MDEEIKEFFGAKLDKIARSIGNTNTYDVLANRGTFADLRGVEKQLDRIADSLESLLELLRPEQYLSLNRKGKSDNGR
jgi:hypothetical protein